MNTYDRAIRPAVEAALFKGKVIVIYGARPQPQHLLLAHL